MSIIEELKKKNRIKYKKVTATVTDELDNKIESICKASGIKKEEYLGALLINSEIEKVYKSLEK